MKLIHSFWTKPYVIGGHLEGSELRKNIVCFAYSVACAKKLNAAIELHTDNLGKKLLEFLPYDKIHTTLEGFDCDTTLWAAGKIETYKHIQLGDVYIDGDVFLEREFAHYQVFNIPADMLFLQTENYFINYYQNEQNRLSKIPFEICWESPYCCGVVRFNNAEAKQKYISKFEKCVEQMKNGDYIVDANLNILFEQWFAVRELAGYKIATIYRNEDELSESYYTGLWHYKGTNKFLDRFQKQILEKLETINFNLHNTLLSLDFYKIVKNFNEIEAENNKIVETETTETETETDETETVDTEAVDTETVETETVETETTETEIVDTETNETETEIVETETVETETTETETNETEIEFDIDDIV